MSLHSLLLMGFILDALLRPLSAHAAETWICAPDGPDGLAVISTWHIEGGDFVDNNGSRSTIIYDAPDRLVATIAHPSKESGGSDGEVVLTVISLNKKTHQMRELLFTTVEFDRLEGDPVQVFQPSKPPTGVISTTQPVPFLQPIKEHIGDFLPSHCSRK